MQMLIWSSKGSTAQVHRLSADCVALNPRGAERGQLPGLALAMPIELGRSGLELDGPGVIGVQLLVGAPVET